MFIGLTSTGHGIIVWRTTVSAVELFKAADIYDAALFTGSCINFIIATISGLLFKVEQL